MVCLLNTPFGPAARHVDTADLTASMAAQNNPCASRSSRV